MGFNAVKSVIIVFPIACVICILSKYKVLLVKHEKHIALKIKYHLYAFSWLNLKVILSVQKVLAQFIYLITMKIRVN